MQYTLDLRTHSLTPHSKNDGREIKVPGTFIGGDERGAVCGGISRVAGIVCSVALLWVYLPSVAASLAYFTDTEGAPAELRTGLLELSVTDPGVAAVGCGGMADLPVPVAVETSGAPAVVRASTTAVSGDAALCDALSLDVELGSSSELVYSGPLAGFFLPAHAPADLRFIAELPASAAPLPDSASCTMHLTFDAWSASLSTTSPEGFSDHDTTDVTFSVVPGTCTSCTPPCGGNCGDVTVNVENTNEATLTNEVVVTSSTGGNSANGGAGGDGGGGEGGGGAGGTIETGHASSSATITNIVNTTVTNVSTGCTCGDTASCGCGATMAATTTLPRAADLAALIQARLDESITALSKR